MIRFFALILFLALSFSCVSATYESETVECVANSRVCNNNASYQVCNASGDGWDITSCDANATCILGVCEALSGVDTPDTGFRDTSSPDTNTVNDTNLDTSAPDTASDDTTQTPEDTTQSQDDTSQSEDTSRPSEDTNQLPEDTTQPPEDTDRPEDTTQPPEDMAPDDPCSPNPCTMPRRTVCEPGVGPAFTCLCDANTVERDGVCVVPELCSPATCNGGGTCTANNDGTVSCMCNTGYVGALCAQCDLGNGYHRSNDGSCTDDPCDPSPCSGAGPCLEAGVCNPETGQCSYTPSPFCTEANGYWRWNFSTDSDAYVTLTALEVNSNSGAVRGTSIDRFGIAIITGSIDARDQGVDLLKDYLYGSSTASFLYFADMESTTRWSGTWAQEDSMGNSGTVTMARQDIRSPQDAAGAWVFEADFSDIDVNLTVDAQGLVEGTMNDSVGTSMVLGVFDLGNGRLRLRKLYDGTENDWWYAGVVNVDGTSISAGGWSADSNGDTEGTWTGRRP